MTTISAQTILRSRNAARPDKVLSTLLLRYPRWIHAEFMTHRVFQPQRCKLARHPCRKADQGRVGKHGHADFLGKEPEGHASQRRVR